MKETCNVMFSNLESSSYAEIYFINPEHNCTDANDYKIAKLNINDSVINVTKLIIADFLKGIQDKIKISIDELEGEDERYVFTVPVNEVDGLGSIIKAIQEEKYNTFNAHDCSRFLEKLKYYIIYMNIGNQDYYFIRRYSKNSLLSPKKIFMVCKENTFEYVENNTIFTLDNVIDAFISQDLVYVVNDKQFSLVTGYYKKEITKANSILNKVEGTGIISNFDDLKEHCTSRISYMKRLSKIDEETLKSISFEEVEQLQNKRDTDFVIDKENKKISFSNRQQLENVINLVLDNFVVSEVTQKPYISVNKRNY